MTRSSGQVFVTIETEGGLLPSDLLHRISEGDKTLPGLTPESYHLAANERINEATTRSWNRLLNAWRSFNELAEKLPESDAGTTLTRDKWLLILFQELGYGHLSAAPRAVELDSKKYPISHFWQKTPIHLVSFRANLDRRPTNGTTTKSSPSSLLQEFLNRSLDHLWGFVSNGHRLRILRDNASLTKQAYVDFDLKAMMDGEAYSDFVLLWMLCHQSRVEADPPEGCWLEQWSQAAEDDGARAREGLRNGVEAAIVALGEGFLAHPRNTALREALRAGTLDAQDYYRELLRLVYRVIFLAAAEDRGLLHAAEDTPEAARYFEHYSVRRLRRLAERRRGTAHSDLYRTLRVVMASLGRDEGCPQLGLPALGSYLWSQRAIHHLEDAEIANSNFLDAIRALAIIRQDNVMRIVDYKRMESEELGSVYESLLELQPAINADAATFALATVGGSERKTSASYYTKTALISAVLDGALDPLLTEAERQPNPEAAILSLKICDPASGSGHFLLAAAQRIGKKLAKVRTGEEEPSPASVRSAVRDAIGHCLYGVDLNPMAVELCKVGLWLEAMEPGKPLSFLENKIKVGNSLIGATPALLKSGIPDDAFEAIEGDDKEAVSQQRKLNAMERKGQTSIDAFGREDELADTKALRDAASQLEGLRDDSITAIHEKEKEYEKLAGSPELRHARLLANCFCAAFLSVKKDGKPAITEGVLRRLRRDPASVPKATIEEIQKLTDDYGFFHWHLEFPQVFEVPGSLSACDNPHTGWSGGFDLVFGNPPWDTLSPDLREFFSKYDPKVRDQDKETQARMVEDLLSDPVVASAWFEYRRRLYSAVHFYRRSGAFRMFAPGNLGKGDFNIFRLFVELALTHARRGGYASQVVPEGLYNGANCMAIRKTLFKDFVLEALWGFENARGVWFGSIHKSTKFCLYVARKQPATTAFRAAFQIRSVEELAQVLRGRHLRIPVSLVEEFSPESLSVMELQSQLDIDVVNTMYARAPKFGDAEAGPPTRKYMREIDMGNDRDLFADHGVPLFEGVMIAQYDYRAAGYSSGRGRSSAWAELEFGPLKRIAPQWFIPVPRVPEKVRERMLSYRVGFRDVARVTDQRTLIATLIPPSALCGHSLPTVAFEKEFEWSYAVWLAIANSFVTDFLARKKVSLHMTYTVLDSLPFPRLKPNEPVVSKLMLDALRLLCTGPEMTVYWNARAAEGWCEPVTEGEAPPGYTDPMERLEARARIDATVARDIYRLTWAQMEYVLSTFPIVEKNETKLYGSFKSKELIRAAFEAR